MTDRLSDDQLDRELRVFLAWQAEEVVDAPSAAEVAVRLGSRRPGMLTAPRSRRQLAWIALALLLMGVVATGALVSGMFPTRDEVRRSYEAVFLRVEQIGAQVDVIVIAVNAQGVEREIVHLPTGSPSSPIGTIGPISLLGRLAAVSPTGLLALPRATGDYRFGWEIVDLRRPGAAPIVVPGIDQDYDVRTYGFGSGIRRRPVAVWGPGDRVAIFMYQRNAQSGVYLISMVDGRTGFGASLPHPDASILPYWAVDGSGIVASAGFPALPHVFGMDGSLTAAAVDFAIDGHGRRYRSDGTPSGTFADFHPGGYIDGSAQQLLTRHGVELGDVAWTADGRDHWLLRPGVEDPQLRLERRTGAATTTVTTLRADRAPPGTIDVGWLAGLAPDDSMVIVGRERYTDITADGYGSEGPNADLEVVVPGTDLRIHVTGYFAGWLEVLR